MGGIRVIPNNPERKGMLDLRTEIPFSGSLALQMIKPFWKSEGGFPLVVFIQGSAWTKPNQFWVTDITYIPIPGNMLYMCAVLDLCGKVVLAWKIGADITSSLVTDTIREALQTEKVTGGLALHSDQGSQYTSQAYFDLAQAYHVSPSMSSPGCPYDNAAMENFFGTLKTECLYRAHFTTRAEVEQLVTEYVDFYNFERIALKNGLTPVEIRSKTA